jgi:hypothetical protein
MMLTRQKKTKKKKEQKRMEKHVTKERGERAETETFMNTKL